MGKEMSIPGVMGVMCKSVGLGEHIAHLIPRGWSERTRQGRVRRGRGHNRKSSINHVKEVQSPLGKGNCD